MKKSKFTEEQIAFALRQAESGTRVAEVCRKMGISEQTYFRCLASARGLARQSQADLPDLLPGGASSEAEASSSACLRKPADAAAGG